MKITGLSHLFKLENLHIWWLTKYFFAPLYVHISSHIEHIDLYQSTLRLNIQDTLADCAACLGKLFLLVSHPYLYEISLFDLFLYAFHNISHLIQSWKTD